MAAVGSRIAVPTTRRLLWNPRPAAVVLFAALLGTTGFAAAPTTLRADLPPHRAAAALHWRSCNGAECATLQVPLTDTGVVPAGAPRSTVDLAVIRVRALDPAHRIGVLVLNPGGPGAPVVDFVRDFAPSLPKELRDRFDLVGFDPRGVGRSTPVDCADDLDAFWHLDLASTAPDAAAKMLSTTGDLVAGCQQRSGWLLPYVSTDQAAQDMDRLRRALGERTITYLGFSYGTYLGARYAARYPSRLRAAVLDGAVDPALDAATVAIQQSVGFERSLDRFLEDCASRPSCAFSRGGQSAAAYDALRARLAVASLPVPGGRRLGPGEFDVGVSEVLYGGRDRWGDLAAALDDADRGDGSALLGSFDQYAGRSPDGTYDDSIEAFFAISCLDGPSVGGVAGIAAIADAAARAAPRLGRAIVNSSLACALWPVPPVHAEPEAVRAPDAPPLLVIGTQDDPATPLAWARGLADELATGVLLIAPGEQHTAFDEGNRCVDRTVVQYLVARTPPRDGKEC